MPIRWNPSYNASCYVVLFLALIILPFFTATQSILAEPLPIPEVQEHVVDTIGLLDQSTREGLNQKLKKLEQDKGSQVVVLIISTTGEESIEEYGIRAAETIKAGRAGVDDGVLLIVAKDDRKVRIEVGYGLEGAIPDATAHRIIQDRIVPAFRAGNFGVGIEDAVDTLDKIIRGEPLPEPVQTAADTQEAFLVFSMIGGIFTTVGVFINLFVSKWLSLTNFLLSLIVGLIVYSLTDTWQLAIFAAGLVAFFIGVFGTIFTAALSSGSGGRGGSSSWSSGSSGWSSSSSSSFSGGGGSFGGGGASGSW